MTSPDTTGARAHTDIVVEVIILFCTRSDCLITIANISKHNNCTETFSKVNSNQ